MKNLIFIICILITNVFSVADKRIYCPLKWIDFDSGRSVSEIPTNAIPSRDGEYWVARAVTKNNGTVIGHVSSMEDMITYSAQNRFSSFESHSYQLLTNTYGCIVQWAEKNSEEIPRFSTHNTLQIARSETSQLAGHYVSSIFGDEVWVGLENGDTEATSNYKLLISYSLGVNLKIVDFDLFNPPNSEEGKLDFMGLDELVNDADVNVIHTVTHTKLVSESISFTESSSTSSSISVSSGWGLHIEVPGLPSFSITNTKGSGNTEGTENTVSNSTTRIVEVTREVIVPPYSSIQVCSTIASNDDYGSDFTARAEFSAPGLSSYEILKHLRAIGVDGALYQQGDKVVKYINGNITATLSMETQFIVAPFNSMRGCSGIQEEIRKSKNTRILQKAKAIIAKQRA